MGTVQTESGILRVGDREIKVRCPSCGDPLGRYAAVQGDWSTSLVAVAVGVDLKGDEGRETEPAWSFWVLVETAACGPGRRGFVRRGKVSTAPWTEIVSRRGSATRPWTFSSPFFADRGLALNPYPYDVIAGDRYEWVCNRRPARGRRCGFRRILRVDRIGDRIEEALQTGRLDLS